jgi:hypothetical protein
VFASLVNWLGPERVMVTFPDADGDEHPTRVTAPSAATVASANRRARFVRNFVVTNMLPLFLVMRELWYNVSFTNPKERSIPSIEHG